MTNFIYSILWRLDFILFEIWGKSLDVISYTLFPWVRRRKNIREKILEKRGYINWDETNKRIYADGFVFSYPNKVPTGNVVSIILGNNKFIKRNFVQNSGLNQEGPYERFGVKIKEGDFVVDAGANLGLFSVLAAKKTGNLGKVFAFEPIEIAQKVLKTNTEINGLSNVEVVASALGDNNEPILFSVEPDSLGSSTAVLSNPKATESLEINQTTLDDFVRQNEIQRIDFIKADIEGMERNMLQGAENTIRTFKPKLAICIYHLDDDPEVIKGLVRSFVPEYKIRMTKTKLYAWTD